MADSDGLEWARFEWLSFDCYGTLVDWETGISTAVGEVLDARGIGKSMNEILALFSDIEPRVQGSRPFLNYRRVLREVMAGIGTQLGFKCSESELDCLAETLPGWPVFPEAAGALEALKSRYRLAVISNVDDDLFAGTAKAVGVDFDAVVTAEQAGSYKPDLRNFSLASERMAVERQRWLHVAESLYHDIGAGQPAWNQERVGKQRGPGRGNAPHRSGARPGCFQSVGVGGYSVCGAAPEAAVMTSPAPIARSLLGS